jgi:hypothetical protein
VLALLELVRDVPRTPNNLASFLVDEVGQLAPAKEVAEAIVRLKDGQFVRETEEGFKLQTRQEKSWDAERRGYLEPRLKDRNDIRREILSEVFSDASVRTFRYENMKTFRVGLSVDDVAVGDPGQITVSVLTADDVNGLPAKIEESRGRSRPPATEFLWAFAMTNELDDLVAQLYASRRMVSTYTQRRAQEQITPNQAELLRGEQAEEQRIHKRLRDRTTAALEAGTGVFQGVARDGTELGNMLCLFSIRSWPSEHGQSRAQKPKRYSKPRISMGCRRCSTTRRRASASSGRTASIGCPTSNRRLPRKSLTTSDESSHTATR